MSFSSKLSEFDKMGKTEDRVKAYCKMVDQIISDKDANKIIQMMEHILDDSFAPVVSRDIIHHLSKSFKNLPNDIVLDLGNTCLEMIQPKLSMLEEEDALIRNEVASVYQAKKMYIDSAKCLQKIKLENTTREVSETEKANTYVTIAENWFYEDDAVNAEIFLNKATHVMYYVADQDINIRYRYWKAKVFDSKRKFILAAQAYYELSSKEDYKIEDENKLALLKNSVTCAILAPVGPQKSRLLTTLYKDERTRNLDNIDMLERMFNDKVINKEISGKFESTLEDHQKAITAEGHTVLEKAVLEHNIRVVSNIYQTISYEGLGTFLGITKENAEKLISNMATEGRISAILDQRLEIIEFEKNEREKLGIWNEQIGLLCNDVNTILSRIINEYPEAEKYLVK
jgi:COP9 signalosome complex subunit 4